jgi:Fe-S-cluster containining protein
MNPAVPIPSLTDAESQRLAARMTSLALEMAATPELADFAHTGWLPDRFFDLLGELYGAYDTYIEHNITGSTLKIQCRAGCSRCCMQAVHGVYAFEVINLYRQLRDLPEYGDIHNAFVMRADEFQRLVAEFMAVHNIRDPNDPQAAAYALAKFAAIATKQCPLLRDNACSVYAQRPVPCRMYHSLTNPIYCMTAQGQNFNIEPPEQVNAILWGISSQLAFPFCEYLAQGLVSFAFRRQFRPWLAPDTVRA